MKIIVDGFGGDYAPVEVLLGCRQAMEEYSAQIILTGNTTEIENAARQHQISLDGIEIVEAPDCIPMEADPVKILKEYNRSSMAVGFQTLAEGAGDAFVTAGSTGAAVVGSSLVVKRLKGIKRAAIGTVIPCEHGRFLLVDSGANHDCRPEMLRQFGVMGSIYMSRLFSMENPRVGLVNIGTEETKGTDLQIEANRLLKTANLHFIGNVEARELPLGGCDVAVCDGFTGNVILKLTEGLAKMFNHELKEMFLSSVATKMAAVAMSGELKKFKKKMDYTEYGGALLLGLRKPVIKAHGSSNAKAFKNAIRQAIHCCERDVIGEIETSLAALDAGDEKGAI